MKIGTAEKIITPLTTVELCGYLARIQPSTGVSDDLYARVLYVEHKGQKIVWIHCDLIGFSNDIANRIRGAVGGEFGIKIKNIFLSATHTHAGPATVFLRKCGDIDSDYIDFLEKTIVAGVGEALGNLEKVAMCFSATTVEGITIDRTALSEDSHIDNKMPVLAFRRSDKSFKAIVVNYAMHNVGLSHVNRKISADISGFAAKLAASEICGSPVVFLTNGGCGNINPAIKTDDYSGVEKTGTILGKRIINEISYLSPCGNCDVSSSFSEIELPLENISIEKLEEIMEQHRQYYKLHGDNYINNRLYEARSIWYDEMKELIKNNIISEHAMAYIHILKFGPVIFVGVNGEVFSKMAEQLCQAMGYKQLYIVGYANGCIGYLAPKKIYEAGGYEVNDAHKFYGHFRLKTGCFEIIRNKVQKKLFISGGQKL